LGKDEVSDTLLVLRVYRQWFDGIPVPYKIINPIRSQSREALRETSLGEQWWRHSARTSQ
ncbi:MAG: hypothetical protein KC588_19390, partial [Nitrospira sp.]|nr:hypothetical protein [Nitrospira sp.]